MVRKVSATRSSLAAALTAAEEREVESADQADEAAALLRDLRTELEVGSVVCRLNPG